MKFSVYLIFFSLLILSGNITAQEFSQATIVLSDGRQLEGQVDLSFDNLSEEIVYIPANTVSTNYVSVGEIEKIIVEQAANQSVVLVRKAVNGAFNKSKETLWMQELISGDVSLYASARDGFVHFRNGALYKMQSDITFYLKRKDESAVSLAGVYYTSAFNVNADNTFRKLTTSYFNDCNELVSRLHDREFGIVEIGTVVEYYNQYQARERSDSSS